MQYALGLPIFLGLVYGGIIGYSAYNAKQVVSEAAWEGVRALATSQSAESARSKIASIVSAHLPTDSASSTGDTSNIPSEYITGILSKSNGYYYLNSLGLQKLVAADGILATQLDNLIGQSVAIKTEPVNIPPQESSSNDTVTATISGSEENTIETVKKGTISTNGSGTNETTYTFNYTGTRQTFVAPVTGKYKLEVWGAQGGADIYAGGKGGYSVGNITLNSGEALYIFVGGKGGDKRSYIYDGGYNGGGYGYGYGGGGGGMTFISTSASATAAPSNHVHAGGTWNSTGVVIVAGGGGGSGPRSGGVGGGLTGGNGSDGFGTPGSGGSQTSSGSGGYRNSTSGGHGYGGSNLSGLSSGGGGGGGGWYGGGAGGNDFNEYNDNDDSGGGGGSGYIGGVQNGETQSGVRIGNGFAQITMLTYFATNWDSNNSLPTPFTVGEAKSVTIKATNPANGSTWKPSDTKIKIEWRRASDNTLISASTYPISTTVNAGGTLQQTLNIMPPNSVGMYNVVYKMINTSGTEANQIQSFTEIEVKNKRINVEWNDENTFPKYWIANEKKNVPIAFKNDGSQILENKIDSEGGNASQDWSKWTHYNNSYYWVSSSQYNDVEKGMVFKGVSPNDHTTYIYDYYPYYVTKGSTYLISVYLKTNTPITKNLIGYIVSSDGGQHIIASQSKTVTLTDQWQKIDFLVTTNETTTNAGFGVNLSNMEGRTVYAALPIFQETSTFLKDLVKMKVQWKNAQNIVIKETTIDLLSNLGAGSTYRDEKQLQAPTVSGEYKVEYKLWDSTNNIWSEAIQSYENIKVLSYTPEWRIFDYIDVQNNTVYWTGKRFDPLRDITIDDSSDPLKITVEYHVPMMFPITRYLGGGNWNPMITVTATAKIKREEPKF